MTDKRTQILALNAIAAIAAKAASDLENNKFWPGDLDRVVQELKRHLQGIKS